MYTKDDVARLVTDFGSHKFDPGVEMGEPGCFGLCLALHDPVSGQVITLARPARTDIGQSEILLTADQVAVAVAGARANRLHAVRAAGFSTIDEAAEAHQRNMAARDLATKQAAERNALATTQAEAASKAAADAAPKKPPAADDSNVVDPAVKPQATTEATVGA